MVFVLTIVLCVFAGVVECYVKQGRVREAMSTASNACKVLGNTPRPLTLLGSVLARDSLSVEKVGSIMYVCREYTNTLFGSELCRGSLLVGKGRYTPFISLLGIQEMEYNSNAWKVFGNIPNLSTG